MADFWNDKLIIGVESLDSQHKYLFSLLDDFFKVAYVEKDNDACKDLIENLIYDVRKHFEYEEALMRKYQYPYILEHEEEHFQFIVLLTMKASFYNDINNSIKYIVKFLDKWTTEHLMASDKALGRFLIEAGVQ